MCIHIGPIQITYSCIQINKMITATFGLLVLVQFPSDTCFIHRNLCFLLWYSPSVFHCCLSPFMAIDSTCVVRKQGWGGGGSRGWQKIVCGCACKIILARNLLRQTKIQCQVPVLIPVLQGNGESSSTDYSKSWPWKRNYDTAFNPDFHMWNVFIYFYAMSQLKLVSTTRCHNP